MIKTIADTIIWLAEEWQSNSDRKCQNINSAIHAIKLEVTQHLMLFMDEHKKDKC